MIRLVAILMLVNLNAVASKVSYTSTHFSMAGKPYLASYHISNEDEGATYKAIVVGAYGIFTIENSSSECTVDFQLPSHLLAVKGDLSLKLLYQGSIIQHTIITIKADTTRAPIIEAYCGPKQIISGGLDYTAVIGTVLDSLDNPWPKNTTTTFQYRYKGNSRNRTIPSKKLYAYHRFYSDNQAGHPVISVSAKGAAHEEFELTLYPGAPQRFSLTIDRDHDYADGKQIAAITTTKITDKNGNAIADGSLVNFNITTDDGGLSKAQATTINGVATLHIPAPDRPVTWLIEAAINQFVNSDPLETSFKSAIQSFTINKKNDSIMIGPIKSFIDQWVPYRTPVAIEIRMENIKVASTTVLSESGMAILDLGSLNLEPCDYTLKATCGGYMKTFDFEL